MGEARAREKIDGYLTKREQVTLGTVAIRFGRSDPNKPAAGGGRDIREKKREAVFQLGIDWVADHIAERDGNPEYAGQRMWSKEQLSADKVPFTIDRDLLAWVLDELDKFPAGGIDDAALGVIEDRLVAMKKGEFRMPAELLGNETANQTDGVTAALDAVIDRVANPPAYIGVRDS